MAIPSIRAIMLPLLEELADGRDHSLRELVGPVADRLGLSEEERWKTMPDGRKTTLYHRLGWAVTALKKAGVVEYPARGSIRITDAGRSILAEKPAAINDRFLLDRFASYREWMKRSKPKGVGGVEEPSAVEQTQTPLEQIETAYQSLSARTADDVLERLRACSPGFFEEVVVQLLLAMGYGGVAGDGTVTGRSGDGGIDGVIREDKLGLDVVCIQAKRWEGSVGRPVIQQFVGGMDGYRAKKGVIMTTSSFSKDALDFVHRIEGKRVVLIDGDRLAKLMVEHDLGVTSTKTYVIKEVSNDFFDEGEG